MKIAHSIAFGVPSIQWSMSEFFNDFVLLHKLKSDLKSSNTTPQLTLLKSKAFRYFSSSKESVTKLAMLIHLRNVLEVDEMHSTALSLREKPLNTHLEIDAILKRMTEEPLNVSSIEDELAKLVSDRRTMDLAELIHVAISKCP